MTRLLIILSGSTLALTFALSLVLLRQAAKRIWPEPGEWLEKEFF